MATITTPLFLSSKVKYGFPSGFVSKINSSSFSYSVKPHSSK